MSVMRMDMWVVTPSSSGSELCTTSTSTCERSIQKDWRGVRGEDAFHSLSLCLSLTHTHTPFIHTLELLPSASLSRVQRSRTHSSLTQAHGNSDTTALSRNESTWMIQPA